MATGGNPGQNRPPRRWLTSLIVGLAVVLGGGLLLLIAGATLGLVGGEEFSPDKFSRRDFVYYEIPLLHIQVTSVVRTSKSSELETYLTRHNYVPKATRVPPRWDPISIHRGGASYWRGDAAIVCTYLDARRDDELSWLAWSKTNPELAQVLWPLVAKVARQELYSFVPDLLEPAQYAKVPDKLKRRLEARLADRYHRLADVNRQLGEHGKAVDYYSESLAYDPKRAETLAGRAESHQALGALQKAAADRATAKKLGR